jgi:hypothetical protein
MNELNNKLDNINELITRIDAKVLEINTKLDELIAALHNYDDGLEMFEDEPKQGACSKHDMASWDEEEQLNKRMDIIGQNGNTGEHYTSEYDDYSSFKRNEHKDEFDDYGKRVGKDKGNNNNPANTRVEEKLIGGYGVPNNAKTGKKKSAIVEHQKYPPHKH